MYIFFLSSGYTTGTNLVTVSPWIQIIHNKTLWLHHKNIREDHGETHSEKL
jgi:hypothetical protein